MSPVLVVTCRWRRRKPAFNGLGARNHNGMAVSRLRSTAAGGLALTLAARCDTSCHVTGYHTPHEAGKFTGYSCLCHISLLVVLEDHPVILSA